MKKILRLPRLYIPLLLVLGLLFRALLVSSTPQPYIADQTRYHDIAVGILRHGIFADATRPYGFPMIIAAWYRLFGEGNVIGWKLMQVLADTGIALLVYFLAKDVFGKKLPALVAFILYLFSPFVAAYAGVLLSEVSAAVCMTLFLLFWHRYFQTKKLRYLMPGVFFLAYLSEIRAAYFFFAVGLFAVTLFVIRKTGYRWYQWALVTVVFLLPFSYAFVGNYLNFQKISPLAVDGGFGRQLVGSQALEGRAPHPIDRAGIFPEPIGQMEWDLRFPYEAQYRTKLANTLVKMGIDMAMKDPWRFLRVRIAKAWYIWEKHYLFIFTKASPAEEIVVYAVNSLLLLSAAGGLAVFWRKSREGHERIFLLTSIGILLYTSAAHMISVAEERYSLPAYPVLFIFAGYAVATAKEYISNKRG